MSARIAGYVYQADAYCPDDILGTVTGERTVSTDVEGQLDGIAESQGIDRYDETTYDSDEFPKVMFYGDGLSCGTCGVAL